MRKAGLALGSALSLAAALAGTAQGMDISLDSSVYATGNAAYSGQASQGLTLQGTLGMGSAAKLSLKVNAAVDLPFDSADGLSDLVLPSVSGASPYLANIELQELAYSFSAPRENEGLSNYSLNLGRFSYADPTGSIYSALLDGISISASFKKTTLGALVGYTGFLPSSTTLGTGLSDLAYGNNGFAPPRALAAFSMKASRVLGHDFFLAFLAQEDLRNDTQLIPEFESVYDTVQSGPMDSAYLTAGMSGGFGALGYSAFGAFQVGRQLSYLSVGNDESEYRFSPVRAFAAGAAANLTLSQVLFLSARIQYGSGDPDAATPIESGNSEGNASFFLPITSSSSGLCFSPQPGNISLLEVSLRLAPFSGGPIGLPSLQLMPKTLLFYKNGAGPISEAGVSPSTGAGLLGLEQDIAVSMRILTDASLSLMGGFFKPLDGSLGLFSDDYVKENPFLFFARMGLTITF